MDQDHFDTEFIKLDISEDTKEHLKQSLLFWEAQFSQFKDSHRGRYYKGRAPNHNLSMFSPPPYKQ